MRTQASWRCLAQVGVAALAGCIYEAPRLPPLPQPGDHLRRGDPGPDGASADPNAGDPSGAADDPPLPPPKCGSPTAYVDDFNDGLLASYWVRTNGERATTAAELEGALAVTIPAGTIAFDYARLYTRHAVDLTDAAMSIEVTASLAASNDVYFVALIESSIYFGFHLRNEQLWFVTDGDVDVAPRISFVARDHRFWRLRHTSTKVAWETSADAITWTPRYATTAPPYAHGVFIGLGGGSLGPAEIEGTVRFDNLNQDRPAVAWCRADSLVDAFEGGVQPYRWRQFEPVDGCTVDAADSGIRFAISAADSGCSAATAAAYDLVGSSVRIDVPPITSVASGVRFFLRITRAGAALPVAEVVFRSTNNGGGSGVLEHLVNGAVVSTSEYVGAKRYWQIGATTEQLTLTTIDSAGVSEVTTAPLSDEVSAVGVAFGIATDPTFDGTPASILVAGYNTP